MKAMKKIKKGLILLLIIVAGWGCISNGLSMYERNKYKAPGQMVMVDGKKMHVYIKGEGEHTIVLMSGLGTVAPVLDFEPLIEELAKRNKVVVVEPMGYGWSEQTDKKRLVMNMVEEMRSALFSAGITEKVTLMPHSISGIYAMYYANTYPEEVEAIAGIDCNLPMMCSYFNEAPFSIPSIIKYAAPSGLARLVVTIRPEEVYPTSGLDNYSSENLRETKAIASWQAYNKDTVMEVEALAKNIETTFDMRFSKKLPVLIFAAGNNKETEDGKSVKSFYSMYLEDLEHSKLIFLEGKHYLHHTCSKEMTMQLENFFEEIDER